MSSNPPQLKRRLSDIRDGYYAWLVDKLDLGDQAVFPKGPYGTTLGMILFQLHEIVFTSPIEGDANRVQDGLALRNEYWNQVMDAADPVGPLYPFFERQASCLEVLIALCIRMEFIREGSIGRYFTPLVMHNLKLHPTDGDYNDRVICKWLNRDIKPNGEGGIYPMKFNQADQTNLELWYQMQQYMAERYSGRDR